MNLGILCAGLTPAWQQICVFDHFRYGEVNRAREVHWCASGKVFNAGIAAHHLGGSSLTLAPVGGLVAVEIERELRALGVPYRFVPTRASTRVCTTILERATGTMTELVEDGRPLLAEEQEAFRQAYLEESARAEVVVLIGSLPRGTPETFYRTLLEATRCPAVLDFRGPGLLSVLDLKPLLVKPNREELGKTFGRTLDGDTDLVDAMRELNRRGARWVLVTQGAGPAWLSSSEELFCFHAPAIEDPVNPIASGDAVAATVAWAVRRGIGVADAVRLGLAAARQNVRHLLPCRLDPDRLDPEAATLRVERVASRCG